MFGLIAAEHYLITFLLIVTFLALQEMLKVGGLSDYQIVEMPRNKSDNLNAILLAVFFILFFALRDPYSPIFADTPGYTFRFESIRDFGEDAAWYPLIAYTKREVLWSKSIMFFTSLNVDVAIWYLFVAAIYILGIYFAVKRLIPNHIFIVLVFELLNMGFYGGGTNGIRNADGLSIVLLALSFLVTLKKKNILIAVILCYAAFQIHNSTYLPSLCMFTAAFILKKPKACITLWIVCVFLSLVLGNAFASLFGEMGFDDRMNKYMDYDENGTQWGFRWDFLIYSAIPIAWGWWVIVKKGIKARTYEIIYNTYVLSNSFFVLVIRAAYSNRFAALSWFLYFLVISYPLLKFKLFNDQGRKISYALGIMVVTLWLLSRNAI